MKLLQKYWPTPFKIKKGDLKSFLVQLILFVVACFIVTWLFGSVLGGIKLIGFVFRILAGLVDLYGTIGVVLCILKFIGLV